MAAVRSRRQRLARGHGDRPVRHGPLGHGHGCDGPELPAPLLRKEFTFRRPVVRARLYISGLAYYDAEINGRRVGRQVLDPGFTNYDETVLYTVHDVTEQVERGVNTIGVTLGRGFYGMTTPNVWNWHTRPGTASPLAGPAGDRPSRRQPHHDRLGPGLAYH
ncbi:alpha-L-rhamnosidase N-terminal domain-containing protein [Streptomyces sp. M10(2022)]